MPFHRSRLITLSIALATLVPAAAVLPNRAQAAEDAEYDRIVLKDGGTVIVGTILSVDDNAVVIKTPNGRELHIRTSDVLKIQQRKYKTAPKPAAEPEGDDEGAPAGAGAGAGAGDGSEGQQQKPNKDGTTYSKKAPDGLGGAVESKHIPKSEDGYGIGYRQTLEEAEKKRQGWKKRGGALLGFDVMGQGSFMYFKPSSSGGCGGMEMTGFGGGGSIHVNFLTMSPPNPDPDPKLHSSSLFLFQLGSGGEFDAFATQVKMSPCTVNTPFGSTTAGGGTTSSGQGQVTVPFNAGLAFGIGGFGDKGVWRGLVVGAAYAPSLVTSFSFQSSSGGSGSSSGGGSGGGSNATTSFNPVGFQLTFDITSLDAIVDKAAQEAHFRILFFGLPPTDKTPLLVTAGIGAVWY
jgi:hypothetical protein